MVPDTVIGDITQSPDEAGAEVSIAVTSKESENESVGDILDDKQKRENNNVQSNLRILKEDQQYGPDGDSLVVSLKVSPENTSNLASDESLISGQAAGTNNAPENDDDSDKLPVSISFVYSVSLKEAGNAVDTSSLADGLTSDEESESPGGLFKEIEHLQIPPESRIAAEPSEKNGQSASAESAPPKVIQPEVCKAEETTKDIGSTSNPSSTHLIIIHPAQSESRDDEIHQELHIIRSTPRHDNAPLSLTRESPPTLPDLRAADGGKQQQAAEERSPSKASNKTHKEPILDRPDPRNEDDKTPLTSEKAPPSAASQSEGDEADYGKKQEPEFHTVSMSSSQVDKTLPLVREPPSPLREPRANSRLLVAQRSSSTISVRSVLRSDSSSSSISSYGSDDDESALGLNFHLEAIRTSCNMMDDFDSLVGHKSEDFDSLDNKSVASASSISDDESTLPTKRILFEQEEIFSSGSDNESLDLDESSLEDVAPCVVCVRPRLRLRS